MSHSYKKTNDALDALLGNYAAEHEGGKLAAEYDNVPCGERRPELEQRIEQMIQDSARKRFKPMLFRLSKLVCIVTFALLLTGAFAYSAWNYFMRDNQTNSDFVQGYTNQEIKSFGFYAIPETLPPQYKAVNINKMETVVELFFDDGQGNSIVYAQSSSNLSHNVDTENSEITKVFLSSGYEGVRIGKAGTTLLWEQDGYFYLLYARDKEIDLARIASSLHTL